MAQIPIGRLGGREPANGGHGHRMPVSWPTTRFGCRVRGWLRPWVLTRTAARIVLNSTTPRCASGMRGCWMFLTTASFWTAPPSTQAAEGSRPTTACCSGAACRPASSGTSQGRRLRLLAAEGDPVPPVGTAVRGAVEDDRRTSLMRTHSGLHLLSGVVFRDFGCAGHRRKHGALEARMDFNLPEVPEGFKDRVAEACAEEVAPTAPSRCRTCHGKRLSRSRHHPYGYEPAAAQSRGRAHCRHRRARHSGRRRHPCRLDPSDRRHRGREGGEQGKGISPTADTHHGSVSGAMASRCRRERRSQQPPVQGHPVPTISTALVLHS